MFFHTYLKACIRISTGGGCRTIGLSEEGFGCRSLGATEAFIEPMLLVGPTGANVSIICLRWSLGDSTSIRPKVMIW